MEPPSPVLLATRRSPLALAQAELARSHLGAALPGVEVRLRLVVTTGDRQRDWSLQQEGGKGLFTRELEEDLLERRADLAVHSSKDLPTTLPDGLALAGFLPRAPVHDVLVRRAGVESPRLVATGSPRRRAQLRARFPEAAWTELRGNVGTRLEKIARGDADATILAAAGLKRLGIDGHEGLVFEALDPAECVPAVGQGAVGLESRSSEAARFGALLDGPTAAAVTLERAILAALGGGCHAAIAAWYDVASGTVHGFAEGHGHRRSVVGSLAPADAPRAAAELVREWGFDLQTSVP